MQFLINGREVDYEDDGNFPLRLYKRLIDFKDPKSRKGETTYSIKLPYSDNNQRILGSLRILSEYNKFRRGITYNCEINSGGQTLINGIFVINQIDRDGYEGYITASTGAIGSLLNGLNLRDITGMLVDYDGWVTINLNLALFETQQQEHYKNLIAFPMVSYGNYFTPNYWDITPIINCSDTYPISSYGNIDVAPKEIFGNEIFNLNDNTNLQIDFRDMPPAAYVVPVLQHMFKDIGYRIAGSWVNTEEAKRLLMPYVGDRNYIYNWEYMANAYAEWLQFSGERVGGVIHFKYLGGLGRNYTAFWDSINLMPPNWTGTFVADCAYRANPTLYPNGTTDPHLFDVQNSVFDPPCLDAYWIFFNALGFDIVVDRSFNMNTVYDIGSGLPLYTTYTAPVSGIYTIQLEFQCVELGIDNLTDAQGNNAYIGISVINGDIPDNLDNFNCLNMGNPIYNETNKFIHGIPATGVYNITTAIELEANQTFILWAAVRTIAENADSFGVQNDRMLFDHLAPYLQAKCTPYQTNDPQIGNIATGTFYFYTYAVFINIKLTISVDNLPTTEPRDQFSDRINVAQNLPDVTQLDFLRSLLNIFNLYVDVDEVHKTVSLETITDFYGADANAYDITGKCADNDFTIAPPDVPAVYNWVWHKDERDFMTTLRGNNYDVNWTTFVSGVTSSVDIDSGIFASTEFENYNLIDTNIPLNSANFKAQEYYNAGQISIPRLSPKERYYQAANEPGSGGYDYMPRLLSTTQTVRRFDGMPNVRFGPAYYGKMDSFLLTEFPNTLSFKVLYPKYYRDFFNGVVKGYEAEVIINMDTKDYANLRINTAVAYNGNIFYLKSIEGYNPIAPKPAKITLFKI